MTEDKFPKTVKSLNSEIYGPEYLDELKKVMDIRKDRKNIYGDSFKDESFENLWAIVNGKMNRVETLLDNQNITHPKVRDEISDVINYLIFILYQISKEEKNGF